MKKQIMFLFLISISIWILISCSDECVTKDTGTILLSSTDKQIIPYTGNEKLVFTDSIGDIKIYKYGYRHDDFQSILGKYVQTGGADCPKESNTEERNFIAFKDSSYSVYNDIDIRIYPANPLINTAKRLWLNIILHDGNKNWYFEQSVGFDDLKLIINTDTTYDRLFYNDKLKLVNHTFYSVYTWKQNKIAYHSEESLQYIYYTIKEGIVGFKTKDGHLWYLK